LNVHNYISKNSIYFSYNKFKQIDYNVQNYYFKVKGLLYKVEADNGYTAYDIFKNYSYRGIFNAKNNYDKSLISLYSERIGKQAFEFFEEKKYEAAIQSFKYALLFPENLQAADFCYDLSFAYKALNDEDNQIKYLRETIKINKDYRQAYEILGMIYFNESLWPMAKEMLEKAAQYESRDKLAIQQYLSQIGNIDMNKEYEAIFNQAIALTTSGRYLKLPSNARFRMMPVASAAT